MTKCTAEYLLVVWNDIIITVIDTMIIIIIFYLQLTHIETWIVWR